MRGSFRIGQFMFFADMAPFVLSKVVDTRVTGQGRCQEIIGLSQPRDSGSGSQRISGKIRRRRVRRGLTTGEGGNVRTRHVPKPG